MNVENLLGRLDKVRQTGPGRWVARCPAHEDKTPSLSIRETDEGQLLIHCFTGCSASNVIAAVGLEFADLYPERPTALKNPERRPFPASDVLRALSHEIAVVAAAGEFILEGRAFSPDDHARLRLAVERIETGLQLSGGESHGR
ncbi:MAG TPA: CHC2 zinc finger domain-containing protein [Candidatus Competibacter sp.]|nr:DNA primase [Candidatus Competibacteraceae bacterium]HRC72032.1 CHC2 zinc finger domain-containing protein [Candidatus Competibacter sp.]